MFGNEVHARFALKVMIPCSVELARWKWGCVSWYDILFCKFYVIRLEGSSLSRIWIEGDN